MQEIKPVKIGPKENAMKVDIQIAVRHPGNEMQINPADMKVDIISATAFVAVDNKTTATRVLRELKPAIVDALAKMRGHKVKPQTKIVMN